MCPSSPSITTRYAPAFHCLNTVTKRADTAANNRKEYFTAPDQFDAFRFARMRAEEPEGSTKYRFSTLGTTYLPFGIGRGAW